MRCYDLNSACVCVNHAASMAPPSIAKPGAESVCVVAGPLFGARPTSCSFGCWGLPALGVVSARVKGWASEPYLLMRL